MGKPLTVEEIREAWATYAFVDCTRCGSPMLICETDSRHMLCLQQVKGRLADCTGGLRETPDREFRFAELLKIASAVTKRESKPSTRYGLVLYEIDGRNGYFVRCETGLTVGIRYVKSTFCIEGFRCVSE